jgi:hypothetical protein
MKQYEDIENELHELADWIEKRNGVHCHSVPRKAAYLINALEEDNIRLRLQLNKRDLYLSDYISRVIGFVRLQWYLYKKRNKRKK